MTYTKMKKLIALAIAVIVLASCSNSKHTLNHSHYSKSKMYGQDGCAWHK